MAVAAYVLGVLISVLLGTFLRMLFQPRRLPGPWEIPFLMEVLILFRPYRAVWVKEESQMYKRIKEYIEKYGGILELRRNGINYVLLSEPETVEPVLSSSVHIKKGDYDYAFMKSWLRDGLLLSFGNKWRSRRKLLTPTFHFKILEDAMGSLSRNSEILTEKLLATGGKPVDIDSIIRSSTLSVILETAMGVSPHSEEKSQNEYIEAIKRVPEAIMKRYYQFWKHVEFLYKLSEEGKAYYKDVETVHSFTKKVIADRKQEYLNDGDSEKNEKKGKRKPFLDHLIQMDISNPGVICLEGINEEVDTFMFEGHDTTAAAINSALFLLANHAAEQEKALEEQISIFGDDTRTPTLMDLQKMEYLEMIIKETLRLYPSVPMISRSLTQDLKINEDTVIPAGYIVVVSPYFVHRSKSHWEDPEEFRPERFAPGTSRHPYAFIPFSAGPRNCIGQKFAMMELKTMLSGILRKCKLEPVTTSITIIPTIVLKSDEIIKIKVTPRHC